MFLFSCAFADEVGEEGHCMGTAKTAFLELLLREGEQLFTLGEELLRSFPYPTPVSNRRPVQCGIQSH